MREDLKSLFRILLLREEDLNHNDPVWMARWIEMKLNLLTCSDTIRDIKAVIKRGE